MFPRPRKVGTRLYLLGGMAREATQELGGWRPEGGTGRVYNESCSGEVAPGMRGALGRACAMLTVEGFVKNLRL